MITQHWLVAALGLVAAVVYYLNTFIEEQGNLEKFGEAYRLYMETVPRMNFVLGIVRRVCRRKAG
jgi:protein-S-isoprenylcysteine O-methyltransferase Ste14